MGFQVWPKSVVFQTPPLLTPTRKTFGCPGTPVAPTVRPPRNGPIIRQRRLAYSAGSVGSSAAGDRGAARRRRQHAARARRSSDIRVLRKRDGVDALRGPL